MQITGMCHSEVKQCVPFHREEPSPSDDRATTERFLSATNPSSMPTPPPPRRRPPVHVANPAATPSPAASPGRRQQDAKPRRLNPTNAGGPQRLNPHHLRQQLASPPAAPAPRRRRPTPFLPLPLAQDAPEARETRANQNIEPQLAVDISAADAPEANETRADQNIGQQLAVNTKPADAPEADEARRDQHNMNIVRSAHSLFLRFKVLFADGIFSFEDRRESQALFKEKNAEWAFKVIEIELSFMYDRLYTKASVSRTKTGMIIRIATLVLILSGSLYTLFALIHATQYSQRHRCVTYTLLVGAVLTEAAIVARYFYSIWSLVGSDWLKRWSANLVNRSRWSGYMAQSNLITFCLQKLPSDSQLKVFFVAYSRGQPENRGHGLASALASGFYGGLRFAGLPAVGLWGLGSQLDEVVSAAVSQYSQRPSVLEQLQSKSFWKKYKKARYIKVQDKLKVFIFEQVKEKEAIEEEENALRQREEENRTPVDRRKPFIDCKGDWALKKENVDGLLGWSFQGKDFDESMLLWHIATDLCFRQENYQVTATEQPASLQVHSGNDSPGNSIEQQLKDHMDFGNEISNYLLYIMVVHPLMLSSSTTMATKRCRDTCAEARRHFLKEHIQTKRPSVDGHIGEENAHTSLLNVETALRASAVKGDKSKSVLWDGCFLAKQLSQIPDKGKRWRVIARVWVEMLCYAAVHCGGYQHAERLKEGGELITFVCLLMNHLGMGKHYRTEVGDAYAHLSPFTARSASRPAPPAQAQGIQQNATTSAAGEAEASTSAHGHQ